jgi:hypothetical protein
MESKDIPAVNESASEHQVNRRDFLKRCGKYAVWVPPTVAVVVSATSLPAHARGLYGTPGPSPDFKGIDRGPKFSKTPNP